MKQSNQSLVTSIKNALGNSISTNLTSHSVHSTLYEAYVFTLVLRAADKEGMTVEYIAWDGQSEKKKPKTLVLRKGPGTISGSTRNFVYAVIHLANDVEVELHKNVYVTGQSGTDHECDVLVLDRGEALACRSERVTPRHQRVALAVECKHYSKQNIGLGLARGFIGLRGDVCVKDHAYFVSNDFRDSVNTFLASKASRNFELQVHPNNAVRMERLRNSFQKRLENHGLNA